MALRHALVIGGTGMLREVSLELARRARVVSVMARTRGDLDALATDARREGGTIEPIAVNYADTPEFERGLRASAESHGPIELVIAWIHSTAPGAARLVADVAEPREFLHVLGTPGVGPVISEPDPSLAGRAAMRYRRVVTGFVIEPEGSRWLTNEEIARGVIDALDSGDEHRVIGTLTPLSARP